jgi:hypothetical protein
MQRLFIPREKEKRKFIEFSYFPVIVCQGERKESIKENISALCS